MTKHYRLLKDLPGIKAGAIFHRKTNETMQVDMLNRVDDQGIFMPPSFSVSDITDFDEWFEEVKESTDSIHWEPKRGDKCFILENANIRQTVYTAMLRDYNAWRVGRVFRTEKECEKAYYRELVEARLRRTSTFEPDFENDNGGWVVFYNPQEKILETHEVYRYDYGEIVRYETNEDAKKSIKENREDWLVYFGVKEGK